MARGRKRHEGKREPNGQLSRKPKHVAERMERILERVDREVRETLRVALEARARVHGITQEKIDNLDLPPGEKRPTIGEYVRDQRASTYVGRLRLNGEISQVQYEAAQQWLLSCEEYGWATCSPRREGAIDLNHVQGAPTATENVARARLVLARHRAARDAVQAVQDTLGAHAHLFAALQFLVERDMELPHMVPDLRTALNPLARHYKLEGRRAAA